MQWSDVSFTPSSRMLRQFAGLLIVVFGGIAVWYGVHGQVGLAVTCGAVAAVMGPIGLVAPQAIRLIFVAWMVLVFPIGWTVSRVLLALLFYLVFTPLGLVFRLIGRDPLHLKSQVHRASYWTPKKQPTEMRSYLRQF